MIVWIVSKAIDIFFEYIMHAKFIIATKSEHMPAMVRISLILF